VTAPPALAPVLVIDALGRKCPIPIIMLAEQIRDVLVGQVIAVRADDPAAFADIPAWCGMKSHECVYRQELPSGWEFGVERQYLSRTPHRTCSPTPHLLPRCAPSPRVPESGR
jgi:tRNA 2-thiouridine synthesizing protein A